jgi:hypothetical protein
MMPPILQLLHDAIGLMHPAFHNTANPVSCACEFYHQFRKLWDKGVPVGYGLGHLLIAPIDATTFAIRRLAEPGTTEANIVMVHFVRPASPAAGFAHTVFVTESKTLETC